MQYHIVLIAKITTISLMLISLLSCKSTRSNSETAMVATNAHFELVVKSTKAKKANFTCKKIRYNLSLYSSDVKCPPNNKATKKTPFTLVLKKGKKHPYILEAIYNQRDDVDFESMSWDINGSDIKTVAKGVIYIMDKLLGYLGYSDKLKTLLINRGESKKLRYTSYGDYHLFDENQKRIGKVSKKVAVGHFARESKRNKHYLRASLEMALILGVAKTAYQIQHAAVVEDWDFDNKSFKEITKRLWDKNQWRLDDNSTSVNWGHIYAGWLYYLTARSNNLSAIESTLVALGGSLAWEVFLEPREVVSITDMIFTSIGGAAVGEAAYQISEMLKTKGTVLAKVLAGFINMPGAVNDISDHLFSKKKTITDARKRFASLGFDRDKYGKFSIITGISHSSGAKDRGSLANIGFESEVVNLPIDQKGQIKSLVLDTVAAEIILKSSFSQDGWQDLKLLFKSVFAGYAQGNINEDQKGRLSGYTFFVGPSMGAEYNAEGKENTREFFAVVNVLGATMDLSIYHKGFRMRVSMDVFADFAMVRPYGIDEFYARGGDFKKGKSVLSKRKYYQAYGNTQRVKLEVEYGRLSAGATVSQHIFKSVKDAWERFPEEITVHHKLKDKRTVVNVWVAYQFQKRLKGRLGVEWNYRQGKITTPGSDMFTVNTRSTERTVYGEIEYLFHGI